MYGLAEFPARPMQVNFGLGCPSLCPLSVSNQNRNAELYTEAFLFFPALTFVGTPFICVDFSNRPG
jgi:hypothetical protein